MSDITAEPEETPKAKSRKPLVIGLILALILGGGGFFAAWSGTIPFPGSSSGGDGSGAVAQMPPVAFVPVNTIIVNLPTADRGRRLKFTAELEVEKKHAAEVEVLMPRIADMLNTYLHAVPIEEFEQPGAMARIRSQILRRAQVVTGGGRVRDLLITEFVLN